LLKTYKIEDILISIKFIISNKNLKHQLYG